jgi:hypothetical protein
MASMASTKVYLQLQVQYHLKLADKRLLQQAGPSSLHTILPYGTCRLQTIASKHTCNSKDIHARHTSMEGGDHSAKQQYRHMSVCGFNVQQCISTNVETHNTPADTPHTTHTHTHTQHSQTQTNTVTQNVCHTHIHAHTQSVSQSHRHICRRLVLDDGPEGDAPGRDDKDTHHGPRLRMAHRLILVDTE